MTYIKVSDGSAHVMKCSVNIQPVVNEHEAILKISNVSCAPSCFSGGVLEFLSESTGSD